MPTEAEVEAEWRGTVTANLKNLTLAAETSRKEFQAFVKKDERAHDTQADKLNDVLVKIAESDGTLKGISMRVVEHEALDVRSFNRLWWALGMLVTTGIALAGILYATGS
jgi:hypothetical protein